jgi:hypothetical protein
MDQSTELALDGLLPTRTLLGVDGACPDTRLLMPAVDAPGAAGVVAPALLGPVGGRASGAHRVAAPRGAAPVAQAAGGRDADETVEPWPPPTPPAVRAYGRRGASPAHLAPRPSWAPGTPSLGIPAYVTPPGAVPHVSGGAWPAHRGSRVTGTHVVATSRRKVEEVVALIAVAAAVVLSLVAARVTGG